MGEAPCAENVNYWKTSPSAPDKWMTKAKQEVAKAGGQVLGHGTLTDGETGRTIFVLTFAFGADRFKLEYPTLVSRAGNERAERIQAATMLYHDVKARCVSAKVLGYRAAFMGFLMLPGGRTVSQMAVPELLEGLPRMTMGLPSGQEG